jgi:hypothetical protein
VRRELFLPSQEGEGRLLLLIDAFSRKAEGLEGRTKLAKLDFLLRYPRYFERAMAIRAPRASNVSGPMERAAEPDIETRMVRYRYGPWDPAYFALLGSLIGRGLVVEVPGARGVGYKTTEAGRRIAERLGVHEAWMDTLRRVQGLKRHFDRSGSWLKEFVYEHFPEVVGTEWGRKL